jgi:hypothetical protein|nr:MAG TPA: hypothetical protein [Caudoviricetes sp.]
MELKLKDNVGKNIVDDCALNERSYTEGLSKLQTKIILTNRDTGEVIFKGKNKLILPGAEFLAMALFDLPDVPLTPSYNTKLNLDNTIYTTTPQDTNKVFLFCVGTDGCGTENSQVYEEDYRKWIQPEALVPFQYKPKNKDISGSLRAVYYGRKTLGDHFAYYFKAFDSKPQLVRQFTNGTSIDSTVYDVTDQTPVETYVSMSMSITKDDCRDYFIKTVGINSARVNTISLCTAWKRVVDGFNYYQDIRPITKLNFPNEPLIDLRKSIDITYQVYF